MAGIYFFTDPAALNAQTEAMAYGPVAGNLTTKYRVTSLFTAPDDPIVVAACAGQVRVQDDVTSSNTLVTIILAPSESFHGIPVKYFIYRGVKKSSLVGASNALTQNVSASSSIVNELNQIVKKYPNVTADDLGLKFKPKAPSAAATVFDRENTDLIESLFYETTDTRWLPVQGGEIMGLFDKNCFGFEIVLEDVWSEPELGLVRNVVLKSGSDYVGNIIKPTETTGTPTATDIALERAEREQVLRYIDPCAFYTNAFRGVKSVLIRTANNTTGNPTEVVQLVNLYEGISNKFFTNNRIYFDIRNDSNFSYNFYDIFNNDILFSADSTLIFEKKDSNRPLRNTVGLSPLKAEYNNWPIFVIEGNSITGSSTGTMGARVAFFNRNPNNTEDYNKVSLTLSGEPYYTKEGKFSVKNNADIIISDDVSKVSTEFSAVNPSFTDDVCFKLPYYVGNGTLSASFIGTYIKVKYIIEPEVMDNLKPRYITSKTDWDNVFCVNQNNTNPLFKTPSIKSKWALTGGLKTSAGKGGSNVAFQSGVAYDYDIYGQFSRITFYMLPFANLITRKEITTGIKRSGFSDKDSFFKAKESNQVYNGNDTLKLFKVAQTMYSLPPSGSNVPFFLTFRKGNSSSEWKNEITLSKDDAKTIRNKIRKNADESGFMSISLTKSQYDGINSYLGVFNINLHPVFINVKSKQGQYSDDVSGGLFGFSQLDIQLVGYGYDGVYRVADLATPSFTGFLLDPPKSLLLDKHIYCTSAAAIYENVPVSNYLPYFFLKGNVSSQSEGESLQLAARDVLQHSTDLLYLLTANSMYGSRQNYFENPDEYIIKKVPINVQFVNDIYEEDGSPSPNAGLTNPNFHESPTGDLSKSLIDIDKYPDYFTNITDSVVKQDLFKYNNNYNLTRYVNLNKDRTKANDEARRLFFKSYNADDIEKKYVGYTTDDTKLYLVDLFGRQRSLEEAELLGAGTVSPQLGVDIKLSRAKLLNQSITRFDLATTLAHELGHAMGWIFHPCESIIMAKMEFNVAKKSFILVHTPLQTGNYLSFSAGITEGYTGFSAGKKDIDFALIKLKNKAGLMPQYPTGFSNISNNFEDIMKNVGFLIPTGGGHLRASISTILSAQYELSVMKGLKPIVDSKDVDRHLTILFKILTFYEYNFFGLKAANLNP